MVKWLADSLAKPEVRGSNLTCTWFDFFPILKNFGFYEGFCFNNIFWLYFRISYFIKLFRQKKFLNGSCRQPWLCKAWFRISIKPLYPEVQKFGTLYLKLDEVSTILELTFDDHVSLYFCSHDRFFEVHGDLNAREFPMRRVRKLP